MKDQIEWDWTDTNEHPSDREKKKIRKKKDPKIIYRNVIIISILLLSIGIAQLVFVTSVRSSLVWRYRPGGASGNEVIKIPSNKLLPNRYVLAVMGYFPHILDDNVAGTITFTHQSSGKEYTFSYNIVGYLMYEKMILVVKLWPMKPGEYVVSWFNNSTRYEYMLSTHGLFNLFPETDRFPHTMETVMLVVSIFVLIASLIASIKRYIKGKRDYAYHK